MGHLRLGGRGVGHGWETPQRKMIGTARWSSLSRATLLLLLLLHVLLDVLPLQQWGCRLFLQPHLLLPGIGEQMGQRQAFLLGEHQLEPKQSPHSAPFSASAPPPWCLGAGILSCDISDLIKYCEGNIYQQWVELEFQFQNRSHIVVQQLSGTSVQSIFR